MNRVNSASLGTLPRFSRWCVSFHYGIIVCLWVDNQHHVFYIDSAPQGTDAALHTVTIQGYYHTIDRECRPTCCVAQDGE